MNKTKKSKKAVQAAAQKTLKRLSAVSVKTGVKAGGVNPYGW